MLYLEGLLGSMLRDAYLTVARCQSLRNARSPLCLAPLRTPQAEGDRRWLYRGLLAEYLLFITIQSAYLTRYVQNGIEFWVVLYVPPAFPSSVPAWVPAWALRILSHRFL